MKNKKVGLLGAGGQARETREYARTAGLEVAYWSTSQQYAPADSSGCDYVAFEDLDESHFQIPVICAVGAPGVKHDFVSEGAFTDYVSIFATTSYVADDAILAEGITIAPGASVTSGARIGSHVLINTGATVSHDVIIADFCTIGPGVNIGGNVTIGEGTIIGIGATIKHGVTIAPHTYVGAGAVVLHDISESCVSYGVPAHIQQKRQGWIYEL